MPKKIITFFTKAHKLVKKVEASPLTKKIRDYADNEERKLQQSAQSNERYRNEFILNQAEKRKLTNQKRRRVRV